MAEMEALKPLTQETHPLFLSQKKHKKKTQDFEDFYINRALREIDRAAGDKLRDKNAEESWEIIENLALYDHEGWNDSRDFVKPVKAISLPPNTSKTPDRRLLELEDQIKFLLKKLQTASPRHIPQAYVKAVSSNPHPHNLNGPPRQDSFTFQKRVRPDPQPQELETSFEARERDYMASYTKRMERIEEEKSVENNGVVGKNIVEPNKSIVAETLEEVDRNGELNDRTNNGPVRSVEKYLTGEKVRELVETPRLHPVRFYLKHKINKELIKGLVGNPRFNDSLLAMKLGKMEGEAYHSLLVEPMRKAMLKKMITKKEDMRGIADDVLVEIVDSIYPVDFLILDIKEERKRPLILGTPFLKTAKAEIREKDEIDPITPISIISKRILEWKERIKFHQEKELESNQWRGKMFNDKNFATTREDVVFEDLFKTYEETKDGHEVIMGDNHTLKLVGYGNVDIEFTSRKKLTLMNVLHVFNIRKNLVSGFKLGHRGDNDINVINKIPVLLNVEDAPKTYKKAITSRNSAFLNQTINDEIDSLISNNTWELLDLPLGSKAIGCRWVFWIIYHTYGFIKTFKAMLVIQGFSQRQGVDYFDTYAPVARITSIRVLFALASIYNLPIHQMDVKTAFLNDNILIVGTNIEGINETKKFLSSCFQMKDMNEVDTILGIKVKRHGGGYALNQCHCIDKIIDKFQHLKIEEANTQYESSCKLVKNNGRVVAQIEYASEIGCLMYATHCTRPDIAYVVCKLSRYTSNPSQDHWKAIGRVFGYLKRTRQLALYYDRFSAVLEG
ncbi:retrovirus-related pol polyprotein from transposon TNT 1-94 [Tanacetum coccineum]